jgi:hypothetical protein
MKIRRSKKRGSALRYTGKFPSLKLNRTVLWGSQVQRDYIYLLEFDSEVLSYEERPSRISHLLVGLRDKYVPDFLVMRRDNKQIIDIKPEEYIVKEENAAFYRLVSANCYREGFEFLIISDMAVRVQPRLDNIKLLWRYARTPIIPQHQILCRKLLSEKQPVGLGELARAFESESVGRQVVYALMFGGMISFDLMQPINATTVLCLSEATYIARRAS